MPDVRRNRFRPAQRLRRRGEFEKVYHYRHRFSTKYFVVNYRPNSVGFDRLGLTVSRKMGGAVRRNRIKRKIRELFRTNRQGLKPSADLVVRPEKTFLEAQHEELQNCWQHALKSIRRKLTKTNAQ